MKEFRVTRRIYPVGSAGESVEGRQGHYVVANDEMHAAKRVFTNLKRGGHLLEGERKFDVQFWKDNYQPTSEVQRVPVMVAIAD